jgi:hypothetical protein
MGSKKKHPWRFFQVLAKMGSKLFHMNHGLFKCVSSQLVSYSIGIISIGTIIGTNTS